MSVIVSAFVLTCAPQGALILHAIIVFWTKMC